MRSVYLQGTAVYALHDSKWHSVMKFVVVDVVHPESPDQIRSFPDNKVAWNTWSAWSKRIMFYFSTYGLSQKGRVVMNFSLASRRSL